MRLTLFMLPLSLCAAPALAQQVAPARSSHLGDLSSELGDPAAAAKLAVAARSLSNVLLDFKVGPLEAAVEGRSPDAAERNLTVRDLARRRDPDFERHLDQQIAAAKPKIEQGLKAVNEALPAIEQSIADAQKALERAMANMPDPDYPRR